MRAKSPFPSLFHMRVVVLGALALLLVGCIQGRPLASESEPEAISTPLCGEKRFEQAQIGTLQPPHYHVRAPTGDYTRNGQLLRFDWSGKPSHLVHLLVVAEWNSSIGGQDLLLLGLSRDGPNMIVEGSSPLTLEALPADLWGDPREIVIEYGPSGNGTAAGSVIIAPQEVRVTVTETYSC